MEVLQRKTLDGRVRKHRHRLTQSSQSSAAGKRPNNVNGTTGERLNQHVQNETSRQDLPLAQQQLQLHGPEQDFQLSSEASLPILKRDDELLIRIESIGLNPIDWKGPAFNFGLPSFPCVLGRDLVGTVIQTASSQSRHRKGDLVLAVSTDYRDYRKAAFQQFAVATDFNVCRVPAHISANAASAVGVAFVTAALTLGISLGLQTSTRDDGIESPDLWSIIRALPESSLPEDVREECFHALESKERLRSGDWLAIWGASSTVGLAILQLAKRAGVKVICIADAIKHGQHLVSLGADVLVHRTNTDEAIEITKAVTGNQLFFGVDTVGKDTAGLLQQALSSGVSDESTKRSHIVGLTGLPKEHPPRMVQHKVPVKLFHESAEIGGAVMSWLERLLQGDALTLPKIDVAEPGGLGGVNEALARLRKGSTDAHRIVIPSVNTN